MDRGGEYMGENFTGRPIILSPPPVDAANSGSSSGANSGGNIGSNIGCNSGGNFSNLTPELPQSFKSQRNQSVGYNLQQEFEALKADLDLDLSLSNLADDNLRSHMHLNVDAHANDLGLDTRQLSLSLLEGTHSINNGSRVFSGSVGPSLLAPAANSNTGYHPQNSSGNGGLSLLLMSNTPGFSLLGLVPSRPQSVNDFSPVLLRQGVSFSRVRPQIGTHFYLEMVHTANWIENLSPQDLTTMLDYWCAHLPFDVLQAMKTRLNSNVPIGLSLNLRTPQVFGNSDFLQYGNTDFVNDMDALSFADSAELTLQQPKPKANGTFKSHLFADSKVQRPKLADPTLHNRTQGPQGPQGSQVHGLFGERKRSPTSQLYEKTNFLQLAAASNVPHAYSQSQPHLPHASDDNFDHSAANKLGALATINSRVALDFNRKLFQPQGQTRPSGLGHVGPGHAVACEESLNRQGNSSSVPVNSQRYSTVAASKIAAPLTPVSLAGSSMPPEIVDQDLLDNIPAWLKLLRLHKYTDSLKDMHWQSLVELSDEDLESKGVKALGARRKLLKAFETVKLSKA